MRNFKSINHIGYAVRDIDKTASLYVKAGWVLSQIYDEKIQHSKIAFLTKPEMTTIELVSPSEGPSPIDNILINSGITPYHICYEVDDIDQAVQDLYDENFKPLFMPIESIAMNNHKICYLHHMEIGLIEIVSSK